MSIYGVTVRGSFAAQVLINVFSYISTGTPGTDTGSFALASALGFVAVGSPAEYPADTVLSHWKDLLVSTFSFQEIEVANLYDPTDFYVRPMLPVVVGSFATESEAPFVSYGLQTNRVTRAVRRGTKRLGGVPESEVGSQGLLTDTARSSLNSLAIAMSEVLSYTSGGASLSFSPSVLSYEKYTTPLGNSAYRPYATESDQLAHAAVGVSWSSYPTVRSQVSRQYGRGE